MSGGRLVDRGVARLGLTPYRWWECETCKTNYPEISGAIRCNGKAILVCPYCAPRIPYPDLSERERLFMLHLELSAAVRCSLWPEPGRDPAADSYLQWKRENGANDWPEAPNA